MTRIWYTDTGAAQALDLSLTRLRELMALGEIKALTVGRSLRIPHDALVEYVRRVEDGRVRRSSEA
ncbi:MAG: helix-turn-helix domain-containing protein [Sporichthyaceae bacterium]|nr:helix-turn-helix domain-containing protein [Sporichthyaceae bacterium]